MEDLLSQIGTPLIAVIVPLVIAVAKMIIPKIPKQMLPIIAGALGPAVELAIVQLNGSEFTGTAGVAAGLAGVGLREVWDQLGKTIKKHEGRIHASGFATVAAIALLGLSAGGCEAIKRTIPGDSSIQSGERSPYDPPAFFRHL
ncbi:MAG: hypothetical protein Kow00114_41830 [Kiloniellaceae bacterium]